MGIEDERVQLTYGNVVVIVTDHITNVMHNNNMPVSTFDFVC